ncbi:MAG: GTPase Era [Candidatus Uhrbacteria bacterium GW2011_GWF2_41_16]|uniref:GTPase Era n=2 Tax=Candidatus Uhriibacteriota TaxID=1752732 RepID=A0A0G0V8R9_9BACT|nr:MAG: GTPase Era [Candidatus Uhrbacteria bacterium GW2011_GWC2_41_11]KKR97433.1 MAG: GTPase Era [Candidatus Uhrbacteria bacterium GW2011_GWF2_41_16]HBP00092.1 GTPase Era [Candidatus Uhrbacteria bacterium]
MPVEKTNKKSGFAVLIGRSNVGKSTLLNALIGSKIAITTPKPQTTRKPVQGIFSDSRGQIVFVDTPGVFKDMRDPLSKKLLQSVKESLKDIDMIVYVMDPTRAIGAEEKYALSMVDPLTQPKILVINKMDLTQKPALEDDRALADRFDQTIELSARTGKSIHELIQAIFDRLPEGEPYYPPGQLTNMPNEEWLAELIREKLFLRLRQEIPYTVHVVVDGVERRENGVVYIAARILTNAERYKRIIIGAGGRGIKEIGQSTRRELESVMDVPIYLDLNVETEPHWISSL